MRRPKFLPAQLHDDLEQIAGELGGVGGGSLYDYGLNDSAVPMCIHGLAEHRDGVRSLTALGIWRDSPSRDQLAQAGIHTTTNDVAVAAINGPRGTAQYARVPFADWKRQMGVVRLPKWLSRGK